MGSASHGKDAARFLGRRTGVSRISSAVSDNEICDQGPLAKMPYTHVRPHEYGFKYEHTIKKKEKKNESNPQQQKHRHMRARVFV